MEDLEEGYQDQIAELEELNQQLQQQVNTLQEQIGGDFIKKEEKEEEKAGEDVKNGEIAEINLEEKDLNVLNLNKLASDELALYKKAMDKEFLKK